MAIKELKTRIVLKYDSYVNWMDDSKEGIGANLILLKGELGICEITVANEQTKDPNIVPTILFKVGDGTKPFKALPWASAKAADVYAWAKASDVVLEDKVIKFVGTDKTITLDYLTPDEISKLISPLAADIAALESADTAQDSLIGANTKAIEDESKARVDADKSINDKIGGSYSKDATVHAAIEGVKQQITDLTTTGQVATNKTDIATNKADIAQLESDLADETAARKLADKGLSDRLDSIEAFFDAADHDGEEGGLTDALDTLKEIQEYLNGDGGVAGSVVGRIAANEEAIEALQDLVEDGGDLEVRVDTVEAGVANLESITAGYSATSLIKTAVDAAQGDATQALANAAAAQGAADAAQDDIDDLAVIVGDTNSGLVQLVNTVKVTADEAAADVAALTARMGTAESNIITIQGIVSTSNNSNANLREAITELQNIVKSGADANATLRTDLKALQDVINNDATGLDKTKEIADEALDAAQDAQSRLAVIEADYLKAADEYIFNCGSSTTIDHTKAD